MCRTNTRFDCTVGLDLIAFRHGVASADPLPDGVLLWTRCTTDASGPVAVDWWVGVSPAQVVARGTAEASPAGDYTVHVDVSGLEPATDYRYGFSAGGVASPEGRTRTAPAPDGPEHPIRLGLTSCAYWSCGFFNAYAGLAARDLDLVVQVGDYLYENDVMRRSRRAVRSHRPAGALVTLEDYRTRHAQYRSDPDLQALHARHPVAAVWDDHELVGGTWRGGAAGHRPERHGPWGKRKAAAVQAYFEWIPVRRSSHESVYRALHLGPLVDLVLLDTRAVGRDEPPANANRPMWRLDREPRSLLGETQWQWLEAQASASTARWLVIANQVMMAPAAGPERRRRHRVQRRPVGRLPRRKGRLYDVLRRSGLGDRRGRALRRHPLLVGVRLARGC